MEEQGPLDFYARHPGMEFPDPAEYLRWKRVQQATNVAPRVIRRRRCWPWPKRPTLFRLVLAIAAADGQLRGPRQLRAMVRRYSRRLYRVLYHQR